MISMSSRRPSSDSPRSTEPSAKKASARRPRAPSAEEKKEGSVNSPPMSSRADTAAAQRVEAPEATPRAEPAEATPRAEPTVATPRAEPAVATPRAEPPVTTPRVEPPVVPHKIEISPQARHAMVAEAAYLRAERRGFAHGHHVEDWLAAEAEVDALLHSDHGTRIQ
jgi:hypothetical protein